MATQFNVIASMTRDSNNRSNAQKGEDAQRPALLRCDNVSEPRTDPVKRGIKYGSLVGAAIVLAVYWFHNFGVKQSALPQENAIRRGKSIPVAFEPRRLNLGTTYQYQTLLSSVQLTNLGNRDLRVTATHSTCGCTVVNSNLVGSIVRAGESIPIPLSFDSGGRDGAWNSALTVRLDDLEGHASYVTQVELFGDVFADFSIEPTVLRFGEVKAGETNTRSVSIVPKLARNFEFTSIESSRPEFIVAARAGTNSTPQAIDVQFVAPNSVKREILSGVIRISTTAPRLREYRIRAEGTVVPAVEVIPQILAFSEKVDITGPQSRLLVRTSESSIVKQMTVALDDGSVRALNLGSSEELTKEHAFAIPREQLQGAEKISITVAMGDNPDRNEARQVVVKVVGLSKNNK